MIGLFISVLFVFLGFFGVVLSMSGMLNSYQQKKIEYMAYRNQAKAKNILNTDEQDLDLKTEEDYYKTHGMATGVIDINFISREIKTNFLNPEAYSSFYKNSRDKIVQGVSKLDFGLILNQSKVYTIKFFNFLKEKYNELVSFLIKITQPVDAKDLEVDHSSSRSALATSSRIKRLNSAFRDISDKSQDFIKNRFAKTKIDAWPDQNNDIEMDTQTDKHPAKLNELTEETDVYQQLEDEILEKLHENLTDYDLWESLGDLYLDQNDNPKASEVFNYISKHSQNETQLLRIKKKIL